MPWAVTLIGVTAVIIFVIAITAQPSKWDGATLLKICRDGTPIVRLRDGTVWARRTQYFGYPVEDLNSVCDR
jgi:hypothetical protein